ncbi:hypothetical protein PV10_03794 [Exophiala mesophila]|uniref:Uncharacterized protein n=1 Tax=Exophiala mesophila TaxID=212818 RepID=A0A0D2A0F5_EXOME|nr:uncharacterized protein PV10_03794 [Exophiala mesophila]KIV92503.1 hypothetical protein PV10_03794 [Exophiala mesophila]
MSVLTPNQACHDLADAISQLSRTALTNNNDFKQLIQHLVRAAESPSNPKTGLTSAIQELSQYLARHVSKDTEDGDAIFTLLANTTRDVPFWRPLFGLTVKARAEQDRLHVAGIVAPDCVVEVARRIVSRNPAPKVGSLKARAALRLIANCCADNDINRSVIVHRDGVAALMQMAYLRRECDLLMPTLYNVCVDYDEPAMDAQGKPWPALTQTNDTSEASDDPIVNAAEQKLGSWWERESGLSSVETLLNASSASDPSSLADVVEMASRVSVYGIHNLIHYLSDTDSDDIVEASSLGMVHQLISTGTEIALLDSDGWIAILQSILNVLSQKSVHGAVLSIDGALWQLINLPYLHPTDDDLEMDALIAPYRKAILKLVYEISSLEAYGNKFNADSDLVKSCVATLEHSQGLQNSPSRTSTSPFPNTLYASVIVLLANTIISPDRLERLLKSFPNLVQSLMRIIVSSSANASELVRPTIDLATRLALCASGQRQLYSCQFLEATKAHLGPTSQTDTTRIEIQRNIIDLARLIIKGNATYLDTLTHSLPKGEERRNINQAPNKDASFISAAIYLFQHTPDTATKLAISRLTIEILRTLMSGVSTTPTTTSDPPHPERPDMTSAMEKTLESVFPRSNPQQTHSVSLAEMISHIIEQSISGSSDSTKTTQQPPSSSSANPEPEGWFGLALLSTFPKYHASILDVLSSNDSLLMKRLRHIVAENLPAVLPQISPTSSTSSTSSTSTSMTTEERYNLNTQSSNLSHPPQDARLANIKVLVVRMVQNSAAAQNRTLESMRSASLHSEASQTERLGNTWQELESVAADLGVDWVMV